MEQTRCLRQAVGDMDVAWSRARLDEKYLIHGFRKFTLGDRYLPEGLLPLRAFVRSKAPSAMSHAIHKIVSIKRCQSYFILRRSPHLSISKDSESCASAHRCLHYAYAQLIARVTFHLQLCGPLGQIPDLGSQAIVEFRLMADHENTSLVFFQCPFQLVFGIHIQMVRWLVQ